MPQKQTGACGRWCMKKSINKGTIPPGNSFIFDAEVQYANMHAYTTQHIYVEEYMYTSTHVENLETSEMEHVLL